MSDEQNHNDPLERLFRKKSEEYNISYREEDWLNLEKQLDARDMKLYYRRRLKWLAAASILILSLIGYYTVQNHNKINQLTEQLNQSEQIQENDQSVNSQEGSPLAENESSVTTDLAQNPDESENSESQIDGESTEYDQHQNAFVEDDSESMATVSEDESVAPQPVNLPRRTIAEAAQTIQKRSVQPQELFPNRSAMLASVSAENQPSNVRGRGLNGGYPLSNGDSVIGSSAASKGPIPVQNGYGSTANTKIIDSRLAVGIVVSPDLSTAGSVSNFDDPGYKGGLMAEYALNKTFSIISGVAISNVKYKADGRAYNPPQAWNYGTMPDRTRAVCVVLDIPINLKANLFNFDRSRIFASAGLSSYIMLNEDYKFQYDDKQQGLETSWSEATGTRHWFSNAGFSIGIEYDLSPNWSIRAEPHIKVPLKGVGWGDVELYSIGNFISLNYRFNM